MRSSIGQGLFGAKTATFYREMTPLVLVSSAQRLHTTPTPTLWVETRHMLRF